MATPTNRIRAENEGRRGIAAGTAKAIPASSAVGPTTREASQILHDRGVFIIPDILGYAGRVNVSYFDWVQGMQSFFWSEEDGTASVMLSLCSGRVGDFQLGRFATFSAMPGELKNRAAGTPPVLPSCLKPAN